jgi:hypothetical protein
VAKYGVLILIGAVGCTSASTASEGPEPEATLAVTAEPEATPTVPAEPEATPMVTAEQKCDRDFYCVVEARRAAKRVLFVTGPGALEACENNKYSAQKKYNSELLLGGYGISSGVDETPLGIGVKINSGAAYDATIMDTSVILVWPEQAAEINKGDEVLFICLGGLDCRFTPFLRGCTVNLKRDVLPG